MNPTKPTRVSSLLGLLVLLACARAPRDRGGECVFNADCVEPLVCAGGICRAQCGSDRDCPRGEVCAPSGQPGKRVCVVPESPQLCAYPSDCNPRSTCFSGRCFTICARDPECPARPIANTCDVPRTVCSQPDLVSESLSPVGPGDGGVGGGDGAVTDGGTVDGGQRDGGAVDGGAVDGGAVDGGAVDVTSDGGATGTDGTVTSDLGSTPDAATPGDASGTDSGGTTEDGTVTLDRPGGGDAPPGDLGPGADAGTPRDVPGDALALQDGGMLCVGTPDLQTDVDNCGRCGNRCPNPGDAGTTRCAAGVCAPTCTGAFTACGDRCVDLRTDLQHCGRCGNQCEVSCANSVCVDPVEIAACPDRATNFVRLSDNTWRAFGIGGWVLEAAQTPPVFPFEGNRNLPSAIPIALQGSDLIMAPASRIYRILPDRTLVGLGISSAGGLGDGTSTPRTAFVPIPGLTDVIHVSASQNGIGSVSCAVYGVDRRVTCWGAEGNFAFANPTNRANNALPAPLLPALDTLEQPLTGVIEVSRAAQSTCALRFNGDVYCWGVNVHGQLGMGFTSDDDQAQRARRVPNLAPATHIAHGERTHYALLADGTVWAWGANETGQLGVGTTTNSSVPVRVPGLSNVVSLHPGVNNVCVITATRELWCWGWNLIGMLAVGGAGPRLSPVRIQPPPGVSALRVRSAVLANSTLCVLTLEEPGPPRIPPRVYCAGEGGQTGLPDGRHSTLTRPVQW